MGYESDESPVQNPTAKELSPLAQSCAKWFRQFGRAVKTARLYSRENELVVQNRDFAWDNLIYLLRDSGAWQLLITPTEILLDEEAVVRPSNRGPAALGPITGPEEELPFTFYRDGIRSITFFPDLERREFDAFTDAVVQIGKVTAGQDDLNTLLWEATLEHIEIETVPLEQNIFLATKRPESAGAADHPGQTFVWPSQGAEVRANLGAAGGTRGLHRDTFDDWRLPEVTAHAPHAYQALMGRVEESRERFLRDWREECARDWRDEVPELFRSVLAISPGEDTQVALGHAVVTWIVDALQRADWGEAERGLGLLRRLDPDHRLTDDGFANLIHSLDVRLIAETLDEAEDAAPDRFSALLVAIGRPAIGLAIAVMSTCARMRPRAAAATALAYLCADEPRLLEPFLRDPRWYVVRNVVFVLGQIGGSGVIDLLRTAANHDEPRVRREVVKSLGSVSRPERTPVLIQQLRSKDPQLLAASLTMLVRERHPRVVKAIVERIAPREFDDLTEENQRAFLNALGEVANEEDVAELERILMGDASWFAIKTLKREAVARILARIGTPAALAILQAGTRSRTEAIRSACAVALATGRNAA